ncbi:uncharacterized protein PHALS_00298 [Plasmopara halstedii]|uniref:Uncharacterized protein n=1 Tax=Plasmopara halstedii TaxID=4781 RepID=A0A0P1A5X1_PLAHL|nr:uncharacterized protein PHALS_00298 [Plasmopara halstedii]CEG35976.1 hypothetical protein PHALS_00298 [Plasmopara halstedii]|eukprot:XP_024572345.1 hypothetical protein PHALS_00298 [Plasmopara halstedii]
MLSIPPQEGRNTEIPTPNKENFTLPYIFQTKQQRDMLTPGVRRGHQRNRRTTTAPADLTNGLRVGADKRDNPYHGMLIEEWWTSHQIQSTTIRQQDR